MSLDHAYGAFLGVLVGDDVGASIEFYKGEITDEVVDKAMKMPGGGVFRIGPGQITDDGELSLSLAHALIHSNPKEQIPIAFGVPLESSDAPSMLERSRKYNAQSEANGALMRIAPLAIWSVSQLFLHDHLDEESNVGLSSVLRNTSLQIKSNQKYFNGGDTDTNTAIVGGMIGALEGAASIPESMQQPVLSFQCMSPKPFGHTRPRRYAASSSYELTRKFLASF